MSTSLPLPPVRSAPKLTRFLTLAWVAILAKCVWVWWAVQHWHLPVHPLWIIAPTLACAALATWLWLVERDP